MTNKEAIRVLKSTSINFSRMGGKTAYVEALEMAITALDQLDNNSTKPDNSTATQFNAIKTHVKGMTACRVPEVAKDTNVPSTELISRQAAIDAMCSVCGNDCDKSEFVYDAPQWEQVILCPEHYALTVLPSVQPEPERTMEEFMYGQDMGNPEDGSL